MDFTLQIYKNLLTALKNDDYEFYTFEEFLNINDVKKIVVLRHDIDKRPKNALDLGYIEYSMGIRASYYIRVVKGTWDESVVKQLVEWGHEVSYHYEDLTFTKGDYDKAWIQFKHNLAKIREFYPARTVCMHGSPLSKWDNRRLWERYDYRTLGIVAEPYFDVDYSKMLYITDTGRGWNNSKASVRDKVDQNNDNLKVRINNTKGLIELVENNCLHHRIMINTHPQRWFPFGYNWIVELIAQEIKNLIKRGIIRYLR
ncbi:MAG: hypothetical protein ACRCZM_10970 [Bacteroidales bacterium]